jgi:hypothetical protein
MTLADARAVIADEIARDRIQAKFRPRARPRSEVDAFLGRYASFPVREVEVEPAAPWLGGEKRGWAVSTLAPDQVFSLRGKARIDTADGVFAVKPLGPAMPLDLLPEAVRTKVARASLDAFARGDIYARWLAVRERAQLADAECLRDDLPTPGGTDLGPFVPFLTGD